MAIDRDPISAGIVSQCEADDCTYNQKQQCNAGAVYFNFVEKQAHCYSYTTEKPQKTVSGSQEVGQVAQCSVIDCVYNEVQACVADSITVLVSDGVVKCDRYIISDSDTQI